MRILIETRHYLSEAEKAKGREGKKEGPKEQQRLR